MTCRGIFKYRGLNLSEAGTFVNDKGEKIEYPASYKLKLDENMEKGIVERNYKIAVDSPLVQQFSKMELYQDVTIDFEVQQFSNSCRLVPISIINNK